MEKIKKALPYIITGLLILGLGIAVYLVQTKQLFRSKATVSGLPITFSPGQKTDLVANSGKTFDVAVNLDATNSTVGVSGVDVIVKYDKDLLEVVPVAIDAGSIGFHNPDSIFDLVAIPHAAEVNNNSGIDPNLGTVRLMAGISVKDGYKKNIIIGTITFKPIKDGIATLSVDGKTTIVGAGVKDPLAVDSSATGTYTIAPGPLGNSIVCVYDPTSPNRTLIKIGGSNFGLNKPGNAGVTLDGENVGITSWTNEQVVATLGRHLEPGTYSIGLWSEGVPVITPLPTAPISGQCNIVVKSAALTAITSCRPAGQMAFAKVMATVTEQAPGALPVFNKEISLDADGRAQGFDSIVLEKDKAYVLVVKAPGSLAKKLEFSVGEGSVDLNIVLPNGDVYPAAVPDGTINSFDKAEMVRQWNISSDVKRTGDLNLDGRVNSLDYSCLRENFGKSNESYNP